MENETIVITYKRGNTKIKYTLPYDINAYDAVNTLYSMLIGATYNEQTILQAMEDFVKDRK